MGILDDSWTDDPGACGEIRAGYWDWRVISGKIEFSGMDWMGSCKENV